MNTKTNPTDLAFDLLPRSICRVQMSAVLYDKHGIFSWGWNSVGSGYGNHAECHCISRANRDRVKGSVITVAGRRLKSKNLVFSLPCALCMERIIRVGIKRIEFHDKVGIWRRLEL